MSETRSKIEATSEIQALETRIEARMASGVGDVPHPLTAPERAVAMQQAREQAFVQHADLTYEPRRYAATSPTERFTL